MTAQDKCCHSARFRRVIRYDMVFGPGPARKRKEKDEMLDLVVETIAVQVEALPVWKRAWPSQGYKARQKALFGNFCLSEGGKDLP